MCVYIYIYTHKLEKMCYTILSAKYIFFSFSSLFFFSQNAQKSFLLSDTTKTDDVKPMRKIKSEKYKQKKKMS